MKVYVVTSYNYEDADNIGVFSTLKKAQEKIGPLSWDDRSYKIVEFVVDDFNAHFGKEQPDGPTQTVWEEKN